MHTRAQKFSRVNEAMITLLGDLDGQQSLGMLKERMSCVNPQALDRALDLLQAHRIIVEKEDWSYLG